MTAKKALAVLEAALPERCVIRAGARYLYMGPSSLAALIRWSIQYPHRAVRLADQVAQHEPPTKPRQVIEVFLNGTAIGTIRRVITGLIYVSVNGETCVLDFSKTGAPQVHVDREPRDLDRTGYE